MTAPVTDPTITNPNPHNLTFPYPLSGTVVRPPGQGCLVCVHQTYCPAVYWFYRYTQEKLTPYNGRQCLSFSTNPADKFSPVKPPDMAENEYIYNQGIGSEANRNGMTDPVTSGGRDGVGG